MAIISDYLYRIQDLTNKNLQILSAINESFSTKKDHLSVSIGGQQYVIPSFICLENKINSLQADFEELVSMPKTGTATITVDGTTQKIQMMGYSNTPDEQHITPVTTFLAEKTDVLKDFMSPAPYVHLNLSEVADNTKTVIVKKVAVKNPDAVEAIRQVAEADGRVSWGAVYRVLDYWEEDKDYTEYDTFRRMPAKTNNPLGHYTVKRICSQTLDEDFEEHYTLELNEDLTYTVENESIEQQLQTGDWLVGNGDRVKFQVEAVQPANRTVQVKVMDGAYAEIHDNTGEPEKYTLRFYRQADYSPFKYINVPLEEDKYICIFAAAVNDDLNIQAPWGDGLFIDTDTLTIDIDGQIYGFREYYDTYVNNLGDSLFGICSMVNNTVNNYTKDEFDAITSYKPVIPADHYTVTQINKHLDDADSVENIRRLYNQKATYKSELDTVQDSITAVTKMLSELSFDDTTNSREKYTGQLSELNAKKTELTNSIAAVSQEIAESANNTELPVENAKYHIRGYADSSVEGMPKIIKLDVEYRYKNKNKFQGSAMTITDEFIYSDWNRQTTFVDMRHPSTDGFTFSFDWEEDSSNKNVPSWNQIDIPISQGEVVDFKVRYTFDLGWPFVTTVSQWSDIVQVEFPTEFLANVDILDIIEENNSDVKSYQFDSKLRADGIYDHVGDKIQDQDITYFHKADSITSGFYTDERRVIPLSDKLHSMHDDILDLKSEVYGVSDEDLVVSVTDSAQTVVLRPFVENVIDTVDYTSNPNKEKLFATIPNLTEVLAPEQIAYQQLTISIYNGGEYNAKLFTMFPGPYKNILTDRAPSKFDPKDYTQCTYSANSAGTVVPVYEHGVWMLTDKIDSSSRLAQQMRCNCGCQNCNCTPDLEIATPQHFNQFIYFRMNDIFNAMPYYNDSFGSTSSLKGYDGAALIESTSKAIPQAWPYINGITDTSVGSGNCYGTLFPYIGVLSNICIDSDDTYKVIKPGETVSIPLSFWYWFSDDTTVDYITKEIAFDFRTSLYRDPVTYRLTVNAGNTAKVYSKVRRDSGYVGSKYTASVTKIAADTKSKVTSKGVGTLATVQKKGLKRR